MALAPAVLRAMAAAGASIEVIIAAVEADLAAQDERKTARRANNAERQRRFKARHKTDGNTEVTHDNAGNALPSVTPSPSLSPQTPQTHPHPCNNNIPARKGAGPAKPEGVSDQTWNDFLAHRKAKRAPVTETVLAGIKREAEIAGWSLEAALVETVSRGWQAFKAAWVEGAKPQGATDGGYLDRLIAKAGASP